VASVYIGTSGWSYKHWRGTFYPPEVARRAELRYIAERFNSVELNGSFYSLQRPESYLQWRAETPSRFIFAIKGSRFITHNKKLKDIETPLANFFASGVLALGDRLGPIVWQLPERFRFDAERVERFFALLPRDTEAAAMLAEQHDARVSGRSWLTTDARRPIRHAIEPRSTEFVVAESIALMRRYNVALVAAHSGRWPLFEEVTADFVYLRLHGAPHTYASRYSDEALEGWAERIREWRRGREPRDARRVTDLPLPSRRSRDVYVYFDNDGQGHAPNDARRLAARLAVGPQQVAGSLHIS
jgi:uncharacterized protein YecE (DUF72 family)